MVWDQIKSKARTSRQQFQKIRESKDEIISLKAQLARYEAAAHNMEAQPGLELAFSANERELQSARRNLGEMEHALEESEHLVTALSQALTAAAGDKAMLDVAARLKQRVLL